METIKAPIKKGFTIIEALVSITVVALLFGIVFSTMIPQMQYSATGRNIADVQKEAVKAHNKLAKELMETNIMFIYNTTNPQTGNITAISFPTARIGGNGTFQTVTPSPPPIDPLTNTAINSKVPDWQGYLIYYLNGDTLRRRFYQTTVTARLSDTQAQAQGGEKVAEGILALRIESGDANPGTTAPTKGPISIIVIANKVYASNNQGGSTTIQQTGESLPYGAGSNTMRIESSVNPLMNFMVY